MDLLATLRRAGPPYRLTAGTLAELSLVSAGAISQRVARAERSVDGLLRHEEALLAPSPASSAKNWPRTSRSCWPA